MTEHVHKQPEYWRNELRRHLERGPYDTPELEPVISDPFDVKTAMYERIIAELDS